jgi:hypothetical protein
VLLIFISVRPSRFKVTQRHTYIHTYIHTAKSKRDFGVQKEFDCSTKKAELELAKLTSKCKTPLEMAQCIANTSKLVKACVEEHYRAELEKNPKATYKEFATDDLLCIILYVITRVPQPLFSCFEYIEDYHFSSLTTTALGFHFAHFQAAAELLIHDYKKATSTNNSTGGGGVS